MKLAPIIAHLKAEVLSLGGRVAGAAELAVLLDGESTLALPRAFVIPGDDSASESNTDDPIVQVLTEQIAVYVAVAPGDGRGQDGGETLDGISAELRAALLPFKPADADMTFEYVGSEHVVLTRAELVHQYVFQTARTIQH